MDLETRTGRENQDKIPALRAHRAVLEPDKEHRYTRGRATSRGTSQGDQSGKAPRRNHAQAWLCLESQRH